MTPALQPYPKAHACVGVSREFVISALMHINTAWIHGQELLEDAAIELGVGLELHHSDFRELQTSELDMSDPLWDFFSFLSEAGLPSPADGSSALDGLSEQELLLAHAKYHLDILHGFMDLSNKERAAFPDISPVKASVENVLLRACWSKPAWKLRRAN